MNSNARQVATVLGVVALLALAGCADVTTTVTVTSDAEIESMEYRAVIDDASYQALQERASENGYDNSTLYVQEEVINRTGIGSIESTFEDRENDVVMEFRATDIDIDELPMDAVKTDNGTIAYDDPEVVDRVDSAEIDTLTYTVEMPGEVVSSNADEVDGSTATWQVEEFEGEALRVEAESGDPIPGFGAPAALLALALVGAGLVALRRRTA